MENENKFCNTFVSYAMFLNNVKSISLLKKNSISDLKLRIRIIINNKFLIHSLGLNYCKTFFGRYRKDTGSLIKDILTKRLTEEQILLDIPKSKQKYFEKKLESIKILTNNFAYPLLKDNYTNIFEYFKIKPETNNDTTYNHCQLVVVSKPDNKNKRLILYGISSSLYEFKHIQSSKYFYNENRSYINCVFLPISLKYRSISTSELNQKYTKIDQSFLNKRNLKY
ncbi:Hypothetical protein MAGb_4950 [Mycoplasmopsis agalactiae 14628]|uniref:Uncharacterized protein n=1 Tax=Mycoplasmopsis agalactiae 14628 TaxID=1110504 RepID=I5D5C1_MYCAA|nr:hypothetical protein [Mycoplasmopsis agalactiae]EIN14880.1 Hypothetical protein MAGb_4950 [Mycoplasmopsis agalactiae 14628]